MQSKGHAVKTYAWPASLTSTNAGVLLTLPDWPDLSVSGASVPEVTLVATDSLSDWVSRRIDEKAKIPEPSDIGLGQILIPINAEAAARLDAYLEERQARMFREANEMQQVYDNRRMAYLTDFRASNEPVARMIEYCNDAATEFAAIGIRFCYILNAGGLIAVPAIMEILAPEKGVGSGVRGSMLLWPAVLFASGVLLGAATNYCAYRSMLVAAEAWTHESGARVKETSRAYYPPENPTTHEGEIAKERASYENKMTSAKNWANTGIGTFVIAILAFLTGVGSAICAIWQSSPPAGA